MTESAALNDGKDEFIAICCWWVKLLTETRELVINNGILSM